MDDGITATGRSADETPPPAPGRRPRWWALLGAAVVVAFLASVVLSTGSSSVPVGGSGSMAGMSMDGDRLAATMRDVDGDTIRLPGGRRGVVLFAQARRCASCVVAAREASAAVQRVAADAQLIVVMADAATSRGDVAAFKRSLGRSPARVVIDDRTSSLAAMLGASELGDALVYDPRGRVVARPDARAGQLGTALRRAGSGAGSDG